MAMHTITATFEIVTPMFLGDANQNATRIRESSIKGALAFWWRALNYSRFVETTKSETEALQAMQTEEQSLFGGPKGQAAFLMHISRQPNKYNEQFLFETNKTIVGPGARYLGYGLMGAFGKDSGKLVRSCLSHGQSFDLQIVFRNTEVISKLLPALKLLGLLGGLGSRVRRGWGSISLTDIHGDGVERPWNAPNDTNEYQKEIRTILGTKVSPSGLAFPLTAFANESRIWISEKRCASRGGTDENVAQSDQAASWTNSLEALDWLGRALVNYRAWGRNGKHEDQDVQKQFSEDHHWFRKGESRVDIPYRTAFGLPHMYDSRSGQGVNAADDDRRASPMLFHIHKIGTNYTCVLTLLPTRFYSGEVEAKRNSGANKKRAFDLNTPYGPKAASGMDALLDFVGDGSRKFKPNQVLSFSRVLP